MFEIVRYTPELSADWNSFVAQSKNATFLFNRLYMDYHSARFRDFSLMAYRRGRLYALLPANLSGSTLYSHQGLTYGGIIMGEQCSAEGIIAVFEAINAFLRQHGVTTVVYKAVPWIYHKMPSEEDLFALTSVCRAQLIVRDISSTISADRRIRFAESRRSGLRKATAHGLTVGESDNFDTFWHILADNLATCHGVQPVHSISELQLLKSRFPDKIKLFTVGSEATMLGGTLLYITDRVVHTQYISATPQGKQLGALDLLFHHLINITYRNHPFIDFGKSTSTDSAALNRQLIFQKEGFGARAVCYDTYQWTL